MLKIKTCPTCGSNKIHLVTKDYHGRFGNKPYVARNVVYYECPACGEALFGPEAMRLIESARPGRARRKRVA